MPESREGFARNIVLVGGSAGAIETLPRILRNLPADFPAAVFIVVHTSADGPGVLPRVLARAGAIPAVHARDGEHFQTGKIYVAPPDHHLTLARGNVVHVRRGPRENGHRPAIDALFRSAVANGYGPRSIAVILSGYLDDGSAGLYAVRSRGGISIIQDPADAIGEDMPANALRYAGADHVLPAQVIGAKLVELVSQSSKVVTMTKKNGNQKRNHSGNGKGKSGKQGGEKSGMLANELVAYNDEAEGEPSVFACPECHGVLFEIKEGKGVRFRCRVGHSYSQATLNEELSAAGEGALWAAMRALDEKASMARRMADASTGPQRWSARLREQADTYAHHAKILRDMILGESKVETDPRTEEREGKGA